MKELLFSITKKDFQISYFNGTGNGGQNRAKTQCCVRLKHIETGITSIGQEERSLPQNLKNAFTRLINKPEFKKWLRIKTSECLLDKEQQEKEINRLVDQSLIDSNLKIEYYNSEETI
jgi:protein subunit release factor A